MSARGFVDATILRRTPRDDDDEETRYFFTNVKAAST